MSSNKKSFVEKLWDFVSGRNRSPTTSDVMGALYRGELARAKVKALYKEQERIENRKQKIKILKEELLKYPEHSVYYIEICNQLEKLFKE